MKNRIITFLMAVALAALVYYTTGYVLTSLAITLLIPLWTNSLSEHYAGGKEGPLSDEDITQVRNGMVFAVPIFSSLLMTLFTVSITGTWYITGYHDLVDQWPTVLINLLLAVLPSTGVVIYRVEHQLRQALHEQPPQPAASP